MALLDIANISAQMDDHFNAKILHYKLVDDSKYAVYNIQLNVGDNTWTIERRYSEFDSYDQAKFVDRKKSFLPPKKLVGNMDPEFLEERKRELEKYVRAILELEVWHQKQKGINSLSLPTARFFDFHQYEVHSIVDDLSIRLGAVGEDWLTTSAVSPKYFEFTPIEMFAITERLRLAEPTAPDPKMAADIGNTIDFLHRVRALKIRGAKGYVGTSNIVWNSLEFSLQFCKNLLALWITDSDVARVKAIHSLSDSLRRIVIHYSMRQIKDLLLDEEPPIPISEMQPWTSLEEADFSFNEVEELDETVRLLGQIQILNLSHNSLRDIGPHLQHLTNLTELNLSHNNISCVKNWNLVLGNIKKLILSGNQIENVEGLCKLYSLEYLDLKENKIENVEDMNSLGRLPCLEVLILRTNPIRKIVDYRSKVLEVFGERAKEIKLDSRLADARELDTVRVRLALRQAKLEKEEKERKRREKIEERIRYISGEVDSLKPGSF